MSGIVARRLFVFFFSSRRRHTRCLEFRRVLFRSPELVVQRYNQSLLIIRSQIDHDGAITAANDTDIIGFARDTYSYMWPRDGALVAAALMRAGHVGAPEKFLQFCSHVISPLGYVRHKYNPDGTLASSWHGYVRDGKPVLPIQEDETALIIWALWQYFELYQRIEETAPFYRTLVTRPADFMLGYVDPATGLPLPSHDLWEERWGVHAPPLDRKSTRLNSSHGYISYAVFCLK